MDPLYMSLDEIIAQNKYKYEYKKKYKSQIKYDLKYKNKHRSGKKYKQKDKNKHRARNKYKPKYKNKHGDSYRCMCRNCYSNRSMENHSQFGRNYQGKHFFPYNWSRNYYPHNQRFIDRNFCGRNSYYFGSYYHPYRYNYKMRRLGNWDQEYNHSYYYPRWSYSPYENVCRPRRKRTRWDSYMSLASSYSRRSRQKYISRQSNYTYSSYRRGRRFYYWKSYNNGYINKYYSPFNLSITNNCFDSPLNREVQDKILELKEKYTGHDEISPMLRVISDPAKCRPAVESTALKIDKRFKLYYRPL